MPRRPLTPSTLEERSELMKKIGSLKPISVVRSLATFTSPTNAQMIEYKAMNRYYVHNLPRFMAKRKSAFTITEPEKEGLAKLSKLFDVLGRSTRSKSTFIPFGIFSRLLMLDNTTGDSLRREFKILIDTKAVNVQKPKVPPPEELKKFITLSARIAAQMLKNYDEGLGCVFQIRREMKVMKWEEGVPQKADPEYFSVPHYPRGNFHLPERNVLVGFRFFANEQQRANEQLFCSVCNASMRYGDLFSVGKLYHCNEQNECTMLKAPDYAHWECVCPQYDRFIDFQRSYLKVSLKQIQGFDELDEDTQEFYNNTRYSFVSSGRDFFGRRHKKGKNVDDD